MTPTHIITDTGHVIPLTADPHGYSGKHGNTIVHVTVTSTAPVATSPAKARLAPADSDEYREFARL